MATATQQEAVEFRDAAKGYFVSVRALSDIAYENYPDKQERKAFLKWALSDGPIPDDVSEDMRKAVEAVRADRAKLLEVSKRLEGQLEVDRDDSAKMLERIEKKALDRNESSLTQEELRAMLIAAAQEIDGQTVMNGSLVKIFKDPNFDVVGSASPEGEQEATSEVGDQEAGFDVAQQEGRIARDPEVLEMQAMLTLFGANDARIGGTQLNVDGYYGPLTRNALITAFGEEGIPPAGTKANGYAVENAAEINNQLRAALAQWLNDPEKRKEIAAKLDELAADGVDASEVRLIEAVAYGLADRLGVTLERFQVDGALSAAELGEIQKVANAMKDKGVTMDGFDGTVDSNEEAMQVLGYAAKQDAAERSR